MQNSAIGTIRLSPGSAKGCLTYGSKPGTVLTASRVAGGAPRVSRTNMVLRMVMRAALLALAPAAPARTRSCRSNGRASLMGSPVR